MTVLKKGDKVAIGLGAPQDELIKYRGCQGTIKNINNHWQTAEVEWQIATARIQIGVHSIHHLILNTKKTSHSLSNKGWQTYAPTKYTPPDEVDCPFNEGDEVRYIKKESRLFNRTGKVTRIHTSEYVWVEFDCGEQWISAVENLELNDGNSKLPNIPEVKCTCDSKILFNFGCKCDAGKLELSKERQA